jgi:hypothetical protein
LIAHLKVDLMRILWFRNSFDQVFLLPMSRVVSDPAKFVSMTAHSTFGRLKSDKGIYH